MPIHNAMPIDMINIRGHSSVISHCVRAQLFVCQYAVLLDRFVEKIVEWFS
jgi:hypothetical protein